MDFTSVKGAFHSAKAKAEQAVGNAGQMKQKLAVAFESAARTASDISATAGGALKCTREYDLGPVVASAGPGCLFAIHDGTRRSKKISSSSSSLGELPQQGSRVSVWLLDKRALAEYPKDDVEALLTLLRKDAAQMLKLRHPGLLSLVAPLEENRHQLALVTEPVFASVADALAKGANLRERRDRPSPSSSSSSSSSAGAAAAAAARGWGAGREQAGAGARAEEKTAVAVAVAVPSALANLALSTLEIKHGTLQLASALKFLHQDAGIVHRALSPETVVITAEGSWKIAGGFGHAVPVNPADSGGGGGGGGGGDGGGMFYYAPPASSVSSTGAPTDPLPLVPLMAYVAPELVLGADGSGAMANMNMNMNANARSGLVTHAADIFSLGALHYELIARRKWLEVPDHQQTVGEYRAALTRRTATKTSGTTTTTAAAETAEAEAVVRYMAAPAPAARPGASTLSAAAYFSADRGLTALQSLDHFLELDVLARAAFLQSLQGSWNLFDGRVLRYRVLPPLLTELRTPQLQALVLPLILQLAERQNPEDFTAFTLPHLAPLLTSATGATLGTILRSTAAFAARVSSPEVFEARVLPAVLRGVEAPEVLVQEEALRQVVSAAGRVRPEAMRRDVMPRLHAAALNTTAAAVRVNALVALGKVAPGLGPPEWDATLAMLRRLCTVDTSAATLMCVLGVADAVGRAGGAALTASRVLPLVCPLTLAPGLNQQQLSTVMKILRGMLDRVEAARMPSLKTSGSSPSPSSGGVGVGAEGKGIGGGGGLGGASNRTTGFAGQGGGGGGGGGGGRGGEGGWAIGGVAGEAAVSSLGSAHLPPPPRSDPFASSASVPFVPSSSSSSSSSPSLFAGMNTATRAAAAPALLAPPPSVANPLGTFALGGGGGGGGAAVSMVDQLAAALSSPDDLEALFTEPGYVPVPPPSISMQGASGGVSSGMGARVSGGGGAIHGGMTVSAASTTNRAGDVEGGMFQGLSLGG